MHLNNTELKHLCISTDASLSVHPVTQLLSFYGCLRTIRPYKLPICFRRVPAENNSAPMIQLDDGLRNTFLVVFHWDSLKTNNSKFIAKPHRQTVSFCSCLSDSEKEGRKGKIVKWFTVKLSVKVGG